MIFIYTCSQGINMATKSTPNDKIYSLTRVKVKLEYKFTKAKLALIGTSEIKGSDFSFWIVQQDVQVVSEIEFMTWIFCKLLSVYGDIIRIGIPSSIFNPIGASHHNLDANRCHIWNAVSDLNRDKVRLLFSQISYLKEEVSNLPVGYRAIERNIHRDYLNCVSDRIKTQNFNRSHIVHGRIQRSNCLELEIMEYLSPSPTMCLFDRHLIIWEFTRGRSTPFSQYLLWAF